MAVLDIATCSESGRAINYLLKEKAHTPGYERNLFVSGVGCFSLSAENSFSRTRYDHGKTGNKVQAYTLVQGFSDDELDPDSPEDQAKAHELGLAVARELFPGHKALVATQRDGKGGKLHNHIVVQSIERTTGKALRGQAVTWQDKKGSPGLSTRHDQLLEAHGMPNIVTAARTKDRTSPGDQRRRAAAEYVWTDDLKQRITRALEDETVTDLDGYAQALAAHDVELVPFLNKSTGEPKGLSYRFTDAQDQDQKVSGTKLGTSFALPNVRAVCARDGSGVLPQYLGGAGLDEPAYPVTPRRAGAAAVPSADEFPINVDDVMEQVAVRSAVATPHRGEVLSGGYVVPDISELMGAGSRTSAVAAVDPIQDKPAPVRELPRVFSSRKKPTAPAKKPVEASEPLVQPVQVPQVPPVVPVAAEPVDEPQEYTLDDRGIAQFGAVHDRARIRRLAAAVQVPAPKVVPRKPAPAPTRSPKSRDNDGPEL